MSDKDAKRNVAKEVERRKLIRDGVKAPHEPGDDVHFAGEEGGDSKAQLSSSLLGDRDRQFLKWRPALLSRSSSSYSTARKALALRVVGSYLGSTAHSIPELGVPEVAFLGRSNVGMRQTTIGFAERGMSLSSDSPILLFVSVCA
jgi:hypothetical protein